MNRRNSRTKQILEELHSLKCTESHKNRWIHRFLDMHKHTHLQTLSNTHTHTHTQRYTLKIKPFTYPPPPLPSQRSELHVTIIFLF